jgi:hypothetical protein
VLETMMTSKLRTFGVLLLSATALAGGTLLLNASPQAPAPQNQFPRQGQFNESNQNFGQNFGAQPGAQARGFLEVGRSYYFLPANRGSEFQGRVLATRGDQWVHVQLRDGGVRGLTAEATWVNLQHIHFVVDATGQRRGDVERPQKK